LLVGHSKVWVIEDMDKSQHPRVGVCLLSRNRFNGNGSVLLALVAIGESQFVLNGDE
jgi:hypothetical protein